MQGVKTIKFTVFMAYLNSVCRDFCSVSAKRFIHNAIGVSLSRHFFSLLEQMVVKASVPTV